MPPVYDSFLDFMNRDKKIKRIVIHFAMLGREFECLKTFLKENPPVFLKIISIVKYRDDRYQNKKMIKILIEKGELQ